MDERNTQYGLLLIIASVFFLINSLDLLQYTIFSKGFSGLLAYVMVAMGAYLVAKGTK